MKKLLSIILVLACLVLLVGCSPEPGVKSGTSESERFTFDRHDMGPLTYVAIITDNVTGQQYLYVRSGESGGLTKMEG